MICEYFWATCFKTYELRPNKFKKCKPINKLDNFASYELLNGMLG